RAPYERDLQACRDKARVQIAGLEQQINERLKPKNESEKHKFPLYVAAKRQGYKDGVQPTDADVNDYMRKH
ncbi:MAG: hypothetical protein ABH878_09345, partial [bacterium]